MKKALLALLFLLALAFSQFTFVPSLDAGKIVRNTFNVSAPYGANCVLEINGTRGQLAFGPTKYFAPGAGGTCTATVTLDAGNYTFKMHGGSYGNVIASGPYEVVPKNPGGCAACDNLGNATIAYVFPVKNEGLHRFEILLVGENSTDISQRFPLTYSPVLVYMHNESYSRLVKAVTGPDGRAYIDYSQDACLQYSFMYCCFYVECGFLECVKAFGIKDDYIKSNNLNNISDIPLGPGASDYPLAAPRSVFPAIEKVDVCPDNSLKNLAAALCFPLTLLAGLLFTSMSLAGKNPFMGFDIGSIRLGRHIKYTPMGVQRGMKMSAQAVQGLATQAASKIKAGKTEGGGLKGVVKATLNAERAPFLNFVKGVGMLATGNLKGLSNMMTGGKTGGPPGGVGQKVTGADAQRGIAPPTGGLGGTGIHVVGGTLGAVTQLASGDAKGALKSFGTMLLNITGLGSIIEAGKGAYYGFKHTSLGVEYTSARVKAEVDFDKAQAAGKPFKDKDGKELTRGGYLQSKNLGSFSSFIRTKTDPDGKRMFSKDDLEALDKINGIHENVKGRSFLGMVAATPFGTVFGTAAYEMVSDGLSPDETSKAKKFVRKSKVLDDAQVPVLKDGVLVHGKWGDGKGDFASGKAPLTPETAQALEAYAGKLSGAKKEEAKDYLTALSTAANSYNRLAIDECPKVNEHSDALRKRLEDTNKIGEAEKIIHSDAEQFVGKKEDLVVNLGKFRDTLQNIPVAHIPPPDEPSQQQGRTVTLHPKDVAAMGNIVSGGVKAINEIPADDKEKNIKIAGILAEMDREAAGFDPQVRDVYRTTVLLGVEVKSFGTQSPDPRDPTPPIPDFALALNHIRRGDDVMVYSSTQIGYEKDDAVPNSATGGYVMSVYRTLYGTGVLTSDEDKKNIEAGQLAVNNHTLLYSTGQASASLGQWNLQREEQERQKRYEYEHALLSMEAGMAYSNLLDNFTPRSEEQEKRKELHERTKNEIAASVDSVKKPEDFDPERLRVHVQKEAVKAYSDIYQQSPTEKTREWVSKATDFELLSYPLQSLQTPLAHSALQRPTTKPGRFEIKTV